MANYDEKEQNVIDNITNTLSKLDDTISNIEGLDADSKSHDVKEWVAEHKAIHEIKHIMNEIGKYGKYDEKEAVADEKELEKFVESLQSGK